MDCDCSICKNQKPFEMPDEILKASKNGELVLFCGAGISTESKTVLPYSFYTSIKNEIKIDDNSLSFSKLMQMYCDKPNGRRMLLKKIKERLEYIHSFPELERRATAFHNELSELYFIKTIITTNWDTYFEECCAATPITIPEDFVFWDENERCVLKIHGSISNLSTIVATENDYLKCTERLEKGIIGATLKTILARNTVVFIGFSFGDEDFEQVLRYLRAELKDLSPHIFIVTVDEHLSEKIDYEHSTCIVTDGTYFLHKLKNILKEDELIANCDVMPIIQTTYNSLRSIHSDVAEISILEYPLVVFNLAYQDGVLHAMERFIQLYKKGIYNVPGIISRTAKAYEKIIETCSKNKNYWDVAYYEGYLNGLILISACEQDSDIVSKFPMYYLPKVRCSLDSSDIFFKELVYASTLNDKYVKNAKKLTKHLKEEGIVIHHPPY